MADIIDASRHEELVRSSVQAIKRNQSANGAIIASPDFSQYNFCWLRDGSFSAYALDIAGEHEAAARYHDWVRTAVLGIDDLIAETIAQRESGNDVYFLEMPPARFTLDGSVVADGWPNFQIDGYGTWIWSLGRHLRMNSSAKFTDEFRDAVVRVSHYLEVFAFAPCYDVWEENGTAVHTSTLACVYGGLVTAAELLEESRFLKTAANIKEKLEESGARLGHFNKSNENNDVDASLLWLDIPFHVVDSNNQYFKKTVSMISERLDLEGGLRRYSTDTYYGSGAWPVLTASLGLHYVNVGNIAEAKKSLDWVAERFDGSGRLGEQFGGNIRDLKHYNEWLELWGQPATDLTWSHAMYVILADAIKKETNINNAKFGSNQSSLDLPESNDKFKETEEKGVYEPKF